MIDLLYEAQGLKPGRYSHLGEETEARLVCAGLARVASGRAEQLNPRQVRELSLQGLAPLDGYPPLSFNSEQEMFESGLAYTGPCLVVAVECTRAAGTIIVYDSLTASGTVAVEEFDLAVGSFQLQEGGQPGAACAIGAYVVLSDPNARVKLVFR